MRLRPWGSGVRQPVLEPALQLGVVGQIVKPAGAAQVLTWRWCRVETPNGVWGHIPEDG